MKRYWLAFSFALLACALAACGDEHSLSIRMVTGLVPGPEFALIRIDLIENGVPFESARTLPGGVETMVAFGQSFAQGRRIAEFIDLAPGTYTVRVQLLRSDDTLLIQQRVRTTLSGNAIVTVHLTRDCVAVSCPSPGGSPAFSECLAGRCVSPECVPPNESEACNAIVFCNDAASCGPTASCATQLCTDGIYAQQPLEGACAAAEWCDPDVGDGCTPYVELDGGTLTDAGTMDAEVSVDSGPDASIPCNAACTSDLTPCVAGFWNCAGPTPVCERLGLRPVNTPCGEDAVCNALGVCTSCRDDVSCRIGCAAGRTSCARGIEECVLTTPTSLASAGTSCTTAGQCVDGDSCGTGDFCSETGSCTPCTPDAACLTGCENGRVDCAMSGACIGDGTHADTGASCGTAMHCTAAHECVACSEGETCTASDPCANGQVSCAAGTPSCVAVSARLLPGASCGVDQVCDTHWTCQHCVNGETCSAGGCGIGMQYCGGGPSCYLASYTPPGDTCDEGVCSGLGECYPAYEVVAVSSGDTHTCAVRSDGSLQCWGDNSVGQLGTALPMGATFTQVTVPLDDIAQVAAGSGYTCAVSVAGNVWCWGQNSLGNLGDGTTDSHSAPSPVTLPAPARSVAIGVYNACALLTTGAVWCWGIATADEFGDYTLDLAPVEKLGLPSDIVQIAVGTVDYGIACALSADGDVWCWGGNSLAQLGNGVATFFESVPVQVVGIDDAIDVTAGQMNACALRASGEVWCWGSGDAALFLDPDVDFNGVAPQRVPVGIPDPITDIGLGLARACALTSVGDLWCWGYNYDYALGVEGLALYAESPPTPVSFLSDVAAFTTGEGSYGTANCATLGSGTLLCWGANSVGQAAQNPDLGITSLQTPVIVRNP
ncbi:MAG: hypothetical protein IPK60_23290 [Sandaracinaceae bacterium]|nr:hypothetical protein [Sandaracinaceae bacterium]